MATGDAYDDEPDDVPDAPSVRERAASRVKGPAYGLILTGVMSVGLAGVLLALSPQIVTAVKDMQRQTDADPKRTAEEKRQMADAVVQIEQSMKSLPVSMGIAAAIGALTLFSGLKLNGLSGRGLGIAAAIINIIPITACCCVGAPIGIWTLVVLFSPEVKAGFAAEAARRRAPDTLDDVGE